MRLGLFLPRPSPCGGVIPNNMSEQLTVRFLVYYMSVPRTGSVTHSETQFNLFPELHMGHREYEARTPHLVLFDDENIQ